MSNKFDAFKIQMDSISDDDGAVPEKIRGKTFEKKEITFFNVGRHNNLEITEVTDLGPCIKDPTWFKLGVTLVLDKRSIKTMVLYPTQALTYGPDGGMGPWKNLQKFMLALGVDLTNKNAGTIIPAVFSDIDRIKGFHVDIIAGHSSSYAHYVERGKYHLYDNFNKPILGVDGVNPLEFDSKEAAEIFCLDQLKMPFSKFVEVRQIYKPAKSDKVLNTNTIKVEKKKTAKIDWS